MTCTFFLSSSLCGLQKLLVEFQIFPILQHSHSGCSSHSSTPIQGAAPTAALPLRVLLPLAAPALCFFIPPTDFAVPSGNWNKRNKRRMPNQSWNEHWSPRSEANIYGLMQLLTHHSSHWSLPLTYVLAYKPYKVMLSKGDGKISIPK